MSLVPKIKYLTNKDLLSAIHESKNTFCTFIDKKYSDFDIIVYDLSAVTPELINAARQKKLNAVIADEKKESGSKIFESSKTLDDIDPEDIVIRLMTFDHIPINPLKEGKHKTLSEKHIRCNFPPFQHFVMKNNEWQCVGKSHWKDGLHNGEFSLDHGRVTNRLASMWIKLVERYGHRGNWRGYCVDTETEALTQRGWLNYQQLTIDDIILSYDIEEKRLKWSKIKSIFKDHYTGNMFHMTVTGMDSLVTPGHKFVTQDGLKKVEYLLEKDKIILMGDAVEDGDKKYQDEFVELVGWVVAEGNFYTRKESPSYSRVTLYQNEVDKANRIRNCLNELGIKFSEYTRVRDTGNYPQVVFLLPKQTSQTISSITNKKTLKMDFILSLTQSQRDLLIKTMVSGDGWTRTQHGVNNFSYCQKDKDHMDMFLALCTISGYRVSCKKRNVVTTVNHVESHIYEANIFSRQKHSNVENINFHGAKRNGKENRTVGKGKFYHPNEPTIPYNDIVWCPQTEYGTFVARRNGYIYVTSNTYVDEMKSQALVQLSQVGLQFDEARSNNPFAYYTTVSSTSFLKILNLEKRSQHIRDDLLIMHGSAPSSTRQVENSMEQQLPDAEVSVIVVPSTDEDSNNT
jgi:hypothetical protein